MNNGTGALGAPVLRLSVPARLSKVDSLYVGAFASIRRRFCQPAAPEAGAEPRDEIFAAELR